jgi:hypothetical protein
MSLFDNWLIMAFLVPISWALVNLLDVYFCKEVFKTPYDGVTISGFFQGLFVLLPIFRFVEFSYNGILPASIGIVSGILFQLACLYYFKALFLHSNVIWMQIIWNLNMAVVPILSFFLLKQPVGLPGAIGIFGMFVGSSLLIIDFQKDGADSIKVIKIMLLSMLFFSFSKICENVVFENFKTPFSTGYTYFSIGSFSLALWSVILKKSTLSYLSRFIGKFSVGEGFSFIATISSERAIFLKGSSTMVVLIEGYTPFFTIILTYFALLCRFIYKSRKERAQWLKLQLENLPLKILSILIMNFGLYLLLSSKMK